MVIEVIKIVCIPTVGRSFYRFSAFFLKSLYIAKILALIVRQLAPDYFKTVMLLERKT